MKRCKHCLEPIRKDAFDNWIHEDERTGLGLSFYCYPEPPRAEPLERSHRA